MRLDALDQQIIGHLRDNARASFAEVGESVGLSAPAVKRRVDRLRENGAIRGFTVSVDPAALGWTTGAYIELYCRGKTSPEVIRRGLEKFPEVVTACTVTGEPDALVYVRATDIRHFESVLEQINAEPYVARTKSVLVLSELLERPTERGAATD